MSAWHHRNFMLKTKFKKAALCLGAISFIFAVPQAFSQDGKPFIIAGSKTYHIKSEINQAVYEIG